jgi:hypothetical protein
MHPTGALRLRRLHLECAEGDEFARRIHPTGGLRPPLLFRGAHVCRRKNDFCDTHTHIRSRAASVSPPWLENRACEDNSADIRTRPSHAAPGAAGVSPPWVCKPRLQLQCDEFPRFEFASAMHPTGALRLRRLHLECAEGDEFARGLLPTGGLTPPALVAVRTFAGKKRFLRYTYTHPVRSGGRQPAVAHETHLPCSSIYFWQTTPQQKPGSDRRGSTS